MQTKGITCRYGEREGEVVRLRPMRERDFGLTSTSFSVNSRYWYHSPPPFPTGIRTRMDNFSYLAVSSKSEPEVLSDLPIGSTAIHPRPEIAKSHAGLHKHKLRKAKSSINNH